MLRHSGPAVSVSNSCLTKRRILSQFEGGRVGGGGRFGQGNIFPPTNNAVHDIELIERDFFTLLLGAAGGFSKSPSSPPQPVN